MNAQDGEKGRRNVLGKFSTLQQRFEESPAGQIMISGLIVSIVLIGVAWNLPDSPIKRGLLPILKPTTVINLNQSWSVYAPSPRMRLETVEVQVTMADGGTRVWKLKPGTLTDRIFVPDPWQRLIDYSVLNRDIRPDVARWVAREISNQEPSRRPVQVAMILRTKNLSPPGEEASRATAAKILYQEDLTD
jgi:hypothetical protein